METRKQLVLLSLIIGLVTLLVVNYVSLNIPDAAESNIDYWRGTVDTQLADGQTRDKAIFNKLDNIERDIKGMCNDITQVKVEAAKNGALYGTASSIISYLIGLLIQMLSRRRNGVKP